MAWWAAIRAWLAAIVYTIASRVAPSQPCARAPSADPQLVGGDSSSEHDLVVVFFPGISLVGNGNASRKAAGVAEAVTVPGHRRVYLHWIAHSTQDAEQAADAVFEHCFVSERPTDYLIVGESYGGVAAMMLGCRLSETSLLSRVRKVHVVTAASPLHGTALLPRFLAPAFNRWMKSHAGDDLAWRRKDAILGMFGTRHFATDTDWLVQPAWTTTNTSRRPRDEDRFADVPHHMVLLQPRVLLHLAKMAATMGSNSQKPHLAF